MLKKLFSKTDLKKNLLVATSGTAIAQLIHIGTTPVITRFYSPEAFGKFTIFLSIITLLTSLSTLKYDLAIHIAEDDEVSPLDLLIKKVSLFVALITLLASPVVFYTGSENYATICVLSGLGGYVSSRFWSTRAIINKLGLFKALSIGKVLENSANAVMAISIGFFKPMDWVLMISKVFGLITSFLYLKSKNKVSKISSKTITEVKDKYINFPKYSLVADIASNINLSLTVFIFTSLFGEESTGHIGLSTRVLSLPINFISISFLDVFRHRAVEDFKRYGSFDTIFKKFFMTLTGLAIPLILVIFFYGPYLFELVFSSKWIMSGEYSKYLVFLYAIRLISSPLSYSFAINENQKLNLYYQFVFIVCGVFSIYLSYFFYKSDIVCVISYSATMVIINAAYLYSAFNNSKIKSK